MIPVYSPHLFGKLTGRFSPENIATFEAAFRFSINHGGLNEIDFVRPPLESLNPRPARTAIILLDLAAEDNSSIIAAGIAASIDTDAVEQTAFLSPEAASLGPIRDLAQAALSSVETLLTTRSAEAGRIAAALWLDRARHLHRYKTADERFASWFLSQTEHYIALAGFACPPIADKLQRWSSRYLIQRGMNQ